MHLPNVRRGASRGRSVTPHLLLRNKKGDLFTIGEIVIALVIVFLLVNAAVTKGSATARQTIDDASIRMMAVESVPGKVVYSEQYLDTNTVARAIPVVMTSTATCVSDCK